MADKEMREPTFWVLTALASGKKHGYALISDTAELSGGRVQLRVGTLYAALDRLVGERLIEQAGEEVVDGRLRRFYRLTEAGDAALRAEVARMQRNTTVALARLSAAPLTRLRGATA